MILGTYEMEWMPEKWTMPDPVLRIGIVKTYETSVVFDFGPSIAGKQIDMGWEWMSSTQFDALDALYQAGLPVAWDPGRGGGEVFTVEIISLEGELHDVIGYHAAFPWRLNVKMSLLILSATPVGLS